ncbi:RNA polymerase sigma-70 factor [Olivibacter domesticus]|uniref:RNA polymerase sigma-70 factor, ECF subfamily n=1 Tax=Olivibacter domesticus TaxID=407022 RepID=A0A1H7H8R0_OLID1|nr:RNA polymerase sigma-70 factor [Olivibacter domesticus]SEK46661.1 RNA polymerase sigma-70 factor, ECF subfamily [Olivibacter domesticus]
MALISLEKEADLLSRVSNGDEKAFERLFYAYYDSLGAFVYQLTSSQILAEEIVQEAFIEVWLRRESLTGIASFKSFMFVLTKNKMLNALRKIASEKLRNCVWQESLEPYQSAEPVEDPIDHYKSILEEAIQKLPPQQQKVFKLSKIERLKQEEIAHLLNLSPETVKKHMKLALKFLRNYFADARIDMPLLVVLLSRFFR